MPTVQATFSWTPTADATGYRLFVNGAQIHTLNTVGYRTNLELDYGEHTFGIEAFNSSGTGPRTDIRRSIEDPGEPPVPVPGAVEGFEVGLLVASGGGAEALYDLGTVPFAYSWPTLPTLTASETVTTYSELNTAIGTNGNDITISSGTYTGNLTLNGSDIRLTFESGAVLVGNIDVANCNRIHIRSNEGLRPGSWAASKASITGEHVRGRIYSGAARVTDLTVQNLAVDGSGESGNTVHSMPLQTRVAWVGVRSHGGPGYCVFSQPSLGASTYLIVAGCDFYTDGTESVMRLQEFDRCVTVENIQDCNDIKHTLRTHTDCDFHWHARNQYNGTGWMCTNQGVAPGVSTNFYFDNNVWYHVTNSLIQYTGGDGDNDWMTAGAGTAEDNTYYKSAASGQWFPDPADTKWTTVSNNTYGGTFGSYPESNPNW